MEGRKEKGNLVRPQSFLKVGTYVSRLPYTECSHTVTLHKTCNIIIMLTYVDKNIYNSQHKISKIHTNFIHVSYT